MFKTSTLPSRLLLFLLILGVAPSLSAQYRGGSGDGSFSASASSAIAPLDLLTLAAQVEAESVALTWRTTNEFALRRFDVERSTDGRAFVKIGTVAAHGYTRAGEEATYTFTDAAPPAGRLYYRLVSVDLDGTSERSSVVSVHREAATGTVDIFPNPSQGGRLHLRVASVAADLSLRIEIFDATGRQLLRRHELDAGNGTATLELNRPLQAGSYLVRFFAARQALPPRLLIVTE